MEHRLKIKMDDMTAPPSPVDSLHSVSHGSWAGAGRGCWCFESVVGTGAETVFSSHSSYLTSCDRSSSSWRFKLLLQLQVLSPPRKWPGSSDVSLSSPDISLSWSDVFFMKPNTVFYYWHKHGSVNFRFMFSCVFFPSCVRCCVCIKVFKHFISLSHSFTSSLKFFIEKLYLPPDSADDLDFLSWAQREMFFLLAAWSLENLLQPPQQSSQWNYL